jgi:hypothetical protein
MSTAATSSRIKRWCAAAIGLALGCASAIATAEIVLRPLPVTSGRTLIGPDQAITVRRWEPNHRYVHSVGWRLDDVHYGSTNNIGFTNPQDYVPADATPTVAVVGDSFVEAEAIAYDQTFFGIIGRDLGERARVYSFGVARAGLAEYLALARAARDRFHPAVMAFTIVQGDVVESDFAHPPRYPGMHYFRRHDGESEWVEQPFLRETVRSALKRSALLRYVYMNLQLSLEPKALARRAFAGPGRISTTIDPASAAWIIDAFMDRVCEASGLPPERILLLMDSDRSFAHALPLDRCEARIRGEIMAEAAARGMRCVDLEPAFRESFAEDRLPLDWFPQDRHWNEHGHAVVADAAYAPILDALYRRAAMPPDPSARALGFRP